MSNSKDSVNRVGIIFSGGPAPAANAVIAAAATSYLEDGREVVGFFHGYSSLQHYDAQSAPLVEGEHYRVDMGLEQCPSAAPDAMNRERVE